jgi:hypothetical protein
MGEKNGVGYFENIHKLPVLEFGRSVTEAGVIQRAVSIAGGWWAKQRVHEAVLLISIRYSQITSVTAPWLVRSASRQKNAHVERLAHTWASYHPSMEKGRVCSI